MTPDLWSLYSLMLKSRLFEEALATLWDQGYISGEMHIGTGEEAVNAGISAHLREGDAMALDHRGAAPLIMRGLDPSLLLHELLGQPDGLCGGKGGHMHLFSKELLTASSGIVGAAGPAASGFALAAQHLRSGSLSIAFFGEGAINQGMLMESMNLAAVWNLPVVFVCKDDNWSITTKSEQVTSNTPGDRARGLGLPVIKVNGLVVADVWKAAGTAIGRVRDGGGPVFIHTRCVHLEGHFLGFQLLRIARQPLKEMTKITLPISKSLLRRGGAPVRERITGLKEVLGSVLKTLRDSREDKRNDPVQRCRKILLTDKIRLSELEDQTEREIRTLLEQTLTEVSS